MSILFIPKLTGLTQSYSVLSCFILNVKISQPWERIFLCLFCKSEDRVRLSHLQTPGPQEGLATGQQTSIWPSRGPGAGNSESFRESTAAPACPRVYDRQARALLASETPQGRGLGGRVVPWCPADSRAVVGNSSRHTPSAAHTGTLLVFCISYL